MKKKNKTFILIEAVLALMVVLMALYMVIEKKEDRVKITVILQNPDDSEWSAFKYGLKMAAEDQNVEVLVISTGEMLNAEDEKDVIEHEMGKGVDALIVEPVPGADTEKMLEEISKDIPVMLVNHVTSREGEKFKIPVAGPDQYELGTALAEEVLRDYKGNLEGKTVGLFSNTTDLQMIAEREQSVRIKLEEAGAKVHWFVAGNFEEAEDTFLKSQPETDVILALDDGSLIRLGEYAAANNLEAAVYGIGNSTDAIYYLDTGVAECLLTPDQFNIGYQGLTGVAQYIQKHSENMQDQLVSYKIIRKETLFSEENQDILFTMSQ